MPIVETAALRITVPYGRRLLGLDLGTKTIGMALSDPGLMIASPIGTIIRRKFTQDAEDLAAIVTSREVGGLVLGLPMNMDGSEGPSCQRSRQFAGDLLARADLFGFDPPIAFWDERLSTSAMSRILITADMSRKRRSQVIDTGAAAYILQGLLDAIRQRPVEEDDEE